MRSFLIALGFVFLISPIVRGQACMTAQGDEVTYGSADTWIGYVYDNISFSTAFYMGYVNEGAPGNPDFDENFGGNNVSYPTNGCSVNTETFSVRYKLNKTFVAGNYTFTVGADDGYRLSLDGGLTFVINNWVDQGYTTTTYTTALSGNYNMVLEYYENGGGNRISFSVQAVCTGTENQTVYGTGDVWNGYIYDGINFNVYSGMVTEGVSSNPNFDQNFGGDDVIYNTSACGVQTQTFSARYRLQKTFVNGTYTFIVGADDGYRLSLDGGSTWVIDHWVLQSYNSTTYSATLNGTYNMVLEYYENAGQNRISINITGVIPVKLISFEGKTAGKNIQLNWTVTEEINNEYYELERSSNGINFLPLAKIFANNQGTIFGANKNYEYTDISPLNGNSYYRLRMVDKDGKYTYSPITRITNEDKKELYIFPTITTGGNIYLRTGVNLKNATVELYDLSGRKLQEIKLSASIAAGQTITLPLRSDLLIKGSYILLCKTEGSTVLKQVIVSQ